MTHSFNSISSCHIFYKITHVKDWKQIERGRILHLDTCLNCYSVSIDDKWSMSSTPNTNRSLDRGRNLRVAITLYVCVRVECIQFILWIKWHNLVDNHPHRCKHTSRISSLTWTLCFVKDGKIYISLCDAWISHIWLRLHFIFCPPWCLVS